MRLSLLALLIISHVLLFSQRQYRLAPINESGISAIGITILMDTSKNTELRKTNTQLGELVVENLRKIDVESKLVYYGDKLDTTNNLIVKFERLKSYEISLRRFDFGLLTNWVYCHIFIIEQQNKRPKDHDIIYSQLRLRVEKLDVAIEQSAEKIAEKLKKTLKN
jgi:hypothetical protein